MLENGPGVTKSPGQLAWDGIHGNVFIMLVNDPGDINITVSLQSDQENKEHAVPN